jgi:uncharacterized protein YcfJ
MKIILKSIVVISFFITSQLAFAGSFVDSATVTSVEKVYKQYRVDEPYQDCYIKETVQNRSGDGSATNELFGAVLGGAIGNKLGKGDGNDAMTLFGAMEKTNSTGQVVVSQEVCENKVRQRIEKRLSHYKINVDYNGHNVSYDSNRRPYDDVVKVEVTISSLND